MRCGALLRLDGRESPQGLNLLAVGRGFGCQVAQDAQESGGGALVGECFKVDGGSQMWGLWMEAYGEQIVPARGHQGINDGREFLLPLRAGGQDDRAGTDNGPVAGFADHFIVAVSEPAMTEYFEMDAGRAVEIRLKGQCLFLFVPGA